MNNTLEKTLNGVYELPMEIHCRMQLYLPNVLTQRFRWA